MPQPRRKYPVLSDWEHKRVVQVELDDDTVVDFRLPDLSVWLAHGKIPNPLRAMAERIEYSTTVSEASMTAEERRDYLDLQAFVIATHVTKPDILKHFDGDVERAKTWVLESMPPGHRTQLWMRAYHFIPADVAASLEQMFPFRDEPAGNGAGPHSPAEQPSS